MNIAVNTRLLLKDKLEGIGYFTCETLKRMTKTHREHHFYFIFDRKPAEEFIFSSNITPITLPPPTRHPFLWYFWFNYMIPMVLRKIKADLFLSPDGYLSLNTTCVSVPVIHDINFEHNPKDLPFSSRHYYKYYFPKFAKKADRIVTVSNYSKSDIAQSYRIDPGKIDVVYNGVDEQFRPLQETEKHIIKSAYTSGNNYFVYVGSLHPRKNITGLLIAFDEFKRTQKAPLKLVLVGSKMFKTDEILKTYNSLQAKQDVIFTGRVSRRELINLIGASLAMTFVPHFEGFGIPLLEAMSCQVPVITSDVTSMPEVCGNAAVYANPQSIQSISRAMARIYHETKLREQLITLGIEQVKKFTWEATSERLWKSIEKVLPCCS